MKIEISKFEFHEKRDFRTWISWKMTFQKLEYCENWYFKVVNFMKTVNLKILPKGGPTVNTTLYPESLIKLTISPWCRVEMSTRLTAKIRSPMWSRPHRSAGLPLMIRPIVEPDREAEEMITKPKPSVSRLVTVTS